jgi:hypothetical protein
MILNKNIVNKKVVGSTESYNFIVYHIKIISEVVSKI